MAYVSYNSNRLIPAPFITLSKVYDRTEAGESIGTRFNLSIRGTLVTDKGSPNSSGNFWILPGYPADESIQIDSRYGALLRKQEALRELFSNDGLNLEFQSLDGTPAMKCNPRLAGEIQFDDGIHVDRVDYTVNLEADVVYVNGQAMGEDGFSPYISQAQEEWSFETDVDQPESVALSQSYRLSHNVSARGKRFYLPGGTLSKPAWEQAREWVNARIGFDSTIALSSGVNNLQSYYGGYNHVRQNTVDEAGGNYSVSESWVIASGSALEDFTVNQSNNRESSLTNVRIEGNIRGLDMRDNSMGIIQSKYTSAVAKFTQVSGLMVSRAQNYANINLNIEPLTQSVGRNPARGTIEYAFEYDNRPSNLVPGSKTESISLRDKLRSDAFASIFILGRAAGPLNQDLGTHTGYARTLNIELTMPVASFGAGSQNELYLAFRNNPRIATASSGVIQTIIAAAHPSSFGGSRVFVSDHEEGWEPTTGRYNYSITYAYQL